MEVTFRVNNGRSDGRGISVLYSVLKYTYPFSGAEAISGSGNRPRQLGWSPANTGALELVTVLLTCCFYLFTSGVARSHPLSSCPFRALAGLDKAHVRGLWPSLGTPLVPCMWAWPWDTGLSLNLSVITTSSDFLVLLDSTS